MTSFFEENLATLIETFPSLGMKVQQVDAGTYPLVHIKENNSWDLLHDGKFLYGKNAPGFIRSEMDAVNLSFPKLVIFYSTGLGYTVQEFFRNHATHSEKIFIIEKSIVLFRRSLEIFDWRPILKDSRVCLLVGLTLPQLKEELLKQTYASEVIVNIKTLTPICDSKAMELEEGSYYQSAAELFKQAVAFSESLPRGHPEDSYQGFMNTVRNLPNAQGVPHFESCTHLFAGFPGIVVSTGPSLDRALPFLKEVKDRAVIACADSNLKILLKNGILPHLTGCVERVPETRHFFDQIPSMKKTWMVTNPLIWPGSYESYPGPKIHLMKAISQIQWFWPEAPYYRTGHSVAHNLFMILRLMGCSPILFVGQDLAFDRFSVRSHADGVPEIISKIGKKDYEDCESEVKKGEKKKNYLAEGNNGEPILTTEAWNQFRTHFGLIIQAENVPCYNLIYPEYGARIENMTRLDPPELIRFLGESRPVAEIIQKEFSSRPVLNPAEYQKKMGERISKAIDYLERYQQITLEVLDSVSWFRHENEIFESGPRLYQPLLNRLEKIVNEIEENFSTSDSDDFYGHFLLAQVQHRTTEINQLALGFLKLNPDSKQRLYGQLNCVNEWFSVVFYWASRMKNFLERSFIRASDPSILNS